MDHNPSLSKTNRLIVLLPDCLANNTEIARKVYWMALHDQRELIYLTLVDDEADIALVVLGNAAHPVVQPGGTADRSGTVRALVTHATQ